MVNGVLRVGGRIDLAELPREAKHPIILDHGKDVTRLIVTDYHRKPVESQIPSLFHHSLLSKKRLVFLLFFHTSDLSFFSGDQTFTLLEWINFPRSFQVVVPLPSKIIFTFFTFSWTRLFVMTQMLQGCLRRHSHRFLCLIILGDPELWVREKAPILKNVLRAFFPTQLKVDFHCRVICPCVRK